MHVVLVSVGSEGDVFPLLTVGGELKRRGHTSTLIASPNFHERAGRHGLEFVPLSSQAEHAERTADTALLASGRRDEFIARYALRWNQRIASALRAFGGERLAVITSAHGLVWADIHAAIDAQAAAYRLYVEPPRTRDNPMPQRVTRARAAAIRAFLCSQRSPVTVQDLHRSAVRRIGLWPRWLVPERPPPDVDIVTGFIGLPVDEPPQAPPLGVGRIVFIAGTRGTTARWGSAFAAVSARVAARLQQGALILGVDSRVGARLPTAAECRPFVPLDEALQGATAIVHHGGVGTFISALLALTPQVAVPRVFGQHSNTERFRRLGLVEVLSADEYDQPHLLDALTRVMTDHDYHDTLRRYAERIDPRAALAETCDYIERAMGV